MKKITHMQYLSLLWVARILGMFYSILLGLSALEAIKDGVAFWDNFSALLINLIPFILIVLVLILGWKKVVITGAGLIIISLAYLYFYTDTRLVNKLIATGPGILNGVLFIVIHFIKPTATPGKNDETPAAP